MVRKSVSHYTDGRNAWKIGVFGLLVRLKGIAAAAVITVTTMGVPWWWPGNFPSSITINLKYLVLLVVFVFGSAFTLLLAYLRKRSMRSLDTKYYLHQLVHDIRDKQTELHNKLAPKKSFQKISLIKS